jgi:hypothetical protein
MNSTVRWVGNMLVSAFITMVFIFIVKAIIRKSNVGILNQLADGV